MLDVYLQPMTDLGLPTTREPLCSITEDVYEYLNSVIGEASKVDTNSMKITQLSALIWSISSLDATEENLHALAEFVSKVYWPFVGQNMVWTVNPDGYEDKTSDPGIHES
jgi:hypothetical protein